MSAGDKPRGTIEGVIRWLKRRYLSNGEDCFPPYVIRLELVEGCPLRCHSCGIAGIRQDHETRRTHLRTMEPQIWQMVASDMWEMWWRHTMVVLSGRGEPALHLAVDRCITEIDRRLKWPYRGSEKQNRIWMESGGPGLIKTSDTREDFVLTTLLNNLYVYVEAGLNVLVLGRRAGYERVWDVVWEWRELIYDHSQIMVYRGKGRAGRGAGPRVMEVWLQEDETYESAEAHAGAGREPRPRPGRLRCHRPARELVVRYDGLVSMCQADWRGEVIVGNLHTQSLYEIWYSPLARALRRRAMEGVRDLRPCSSCDYRSSSHDLMHGLVGTPLPGDRELVEEALARGPETVPVLRPWEVVWGPDGEIADVLLRGRRHELGGPSGDVVAEEEGPDA